MSASDPTSEQRLLLGEDLSDTSRFIAEQNVIWLRTTARGYGFMERIHAKVVSVGVKTIRIEAPLSKGGTKKTNVRPHNLVPE